ncbi:MAG TPA: GntR family transcriptional regulator [Gaiellaceae bacterium]|nr:GntR family transcriptional regulator [Gaiellaceae bacterium]
MAETTTERRALVDKLAATLQARVLSGELPSGSRLRQEALAEEFGVSRTPVREALRKLQAHGLVELEPNRGALVRALTPPEIRDAYEVRAELEGLAAELACERIQHEQIDALHGAQREFRRALEHTVAARARGAGSSAREIDRWGRANDVFHQKILEASGNVVLLQTIAHLHRSFPRDLSRTVLGESTKLLESNVGEHEAILGALERHDGAQARELMVAHVRNAGRLVVLRAEQRLAAS